MRDDTKPPATATDAEIELEIRQRRKFTAQEALGRMAGPGAMKGGSAVPRQQEAEVEVGNWLRSHVEDTSGALRSVLHRHLKASALLPENLDRPLVAVAAFIRRALSSDNALREIVREADVEWGRMMDERPHFERAGSAPDPADPYTLESVRQALQLAQTQLGEEGS